MERRIWADTENQIIRDNYPATGPVFTTNVLHAAGFNDRDALKVMKQASKLGVKRNKKCPGVFDTRKLWKSNKIGRFDVPIAPELS